MVSEKKLPQKSSEIESIMSCSKKIMMTKIVLSVFLPLMSVGCVKTVDSQKGLKRNVLSGESSLTGVWDWRLEMVTDDQDFRIERESWVLKEDGDRKVTGTYWRKVTVISKDDKPFECNNERRYDLEAEFTVEGTVRNGVVSFREKAVRVKPGPCEQGRRNLDEYKGQLVNKHLVLKWGNVKQSLKRRVLTGVWVQEIRTTLPDGDPALSVETWHIHQAGKKIRGVRLARDARSSSDKKPYQCNGRLKMGRYIKWDFEGVLDINTARIRFKSHTPKKSPCENRTFDEKEVVLRLGNEKNTLDLEANGSTIELVRQSGLNPLRAGL